MRSYRLFVAVFAAVCMGFAAEAATAIDWVGGGADNKTTTLANWSIGGETPTELPDLTGGTLAVSLKSGTGMQFEDGTWFDSITNDLPQVVDNKIVPFTIEPTVPNGKIILSNGFTSYGKEMGASKKADYVRHAQLVIKGHWALPDGVEGGSASFDNPRAFRYNASLYDKTLNGGIVLHDQGTGLALILDNATIDMPFCTFIMINGVTISATNNSVNVFNGEVSVEEQKSATHAAAGAEIRFNGKVKGPNFTREFFGSGRIVMNGRIDSLQGALVANDVRLVLANTNNVMTGSTSREGLNFNGDGIIECVTNDCFAHDLQLGNISNVSKGVPTYNGYGKLELHSTTQQVGRLSFFKATNGYINGDFGSMIEINGTSRSGATANCLGPLVFPLPINGGVSMHIMCAADQTYVLSNRTFASCGNLIVSGGTLELAANAKWLNGTNFVMKSEGTMAFAKAGQVNRESAEFHFSGNGKVYIPEGVTLEVKHAVIDGETEKLMQSGGYDANATGDMAGRVTGGGTLMVLKSARDVQSYVETTDDMTKDADWEVLVDEGCTNVVKVTQTNHKIIKRGLGILCLNAPNSVSGIDIEGGYVYVGANDCLGHGTVTIFGQREGYTGPCGLRFSTDGVTNSANLVVTGNTTLQYPAMFINSTTNAFLGKITAAQDFMILEEVYYLWQYYYELQKPSVSGIWSMKVNQHIGMDFGGEIDVAGKFHLLPDCSYNFRKSVRASVFETIMTDDKKYRIHQGYETDSCGYISFYDTNRFDEMIAGYRNLYFYGEDSLGGAKVRCDYQPLSNAGLNLYGTTNYIASCVHAKPAAALDSIVSRFSGSACTLIVTGSTENVETYTKFDSLAKLRLDAAENPDFTMTLMGRPHNLVGPLDVNAGTLILTNDAKLAMSTLTIGEDGRLIVATTNNIIAFPNVTALTVNGRLDSPAAAFNSAKTALSQLSLGEDAQLNLQGGDLRVNALYVNGQPRLAGSYDASVYTQITSGRVVVLADAPGFTPTPATWNGSEWTPSNVNPRDGSVAATFDSTVSASTFDSAVRLYGLTFDSDVAGYSIGGSGRLSIGAGGIKITEAGNTANTYSFTLPTELESSQDWIIPPYKKLVFDDAITNQVGTITVRGGKRLKIPCDLVFRGTNVIAGAMVVTGATINVYGLLGTPNHVDQGKASKNGAKTLTIIGNDGGLASIHMINGTIEKPIYPQYSDVGVFTSADSTTNYFLGNVTSGNPWHGYKPGKNSELVFEGGNTAGWSMRTSGSDATSIIRIREKPINFTASVGLNIKAGTFALDVEGNKFNYFSTAHGNGDTGYVDFGVSYAITNGINGAFLPGFYYSGSSFMHATSGKPKVYFHSTTQVISTVAGGKMATLYADEGARLEVTTQTSPKSTELPDSRIYFSSQIEGPLTLVMRGDGALPFILSNQTFKSTGSLVVTKGTMEVAADAEWKGAPTVEIGGTGKLLVGKAGSLGRSSALSIADSGELYIQDGGEQRFSEAVVNGVQLPKGTYTPSSPETSGFLKQGSIRISPKGTALILF